MKNLVKSKKGFTLVELIVVIGVLALLAVGSVMAFNGVQRNARRSVVRTEAMSLAAALNNYNAAIITGQLTTVQDVRDKGTVDGNFIFVDLKTTPPAGSLSRPLDYSIIIHPREWRGLNGTALAWFNYITGDPLQPIASSGPITHSGGATGRWTVNEDWIEANVQ
jgi:prepilin-type N-terminal cleavage/methylation domain-containing protein